MKTKNVYRLVGLCILGCTLILSYIYLRSWRHSYLPSHVHYDSNAINNLKKSSLSNHEANKSNGRSAKDGGWFSMLKPYELYAYTAFYDDRPALDGKRVVRVIAVMEVVEGQKIYCGVWYSEEDEEEPPDIIQARQLKIGYGVFRHDKFFKEFILSCELDSKHKVPIAVTLIPSDTSRASFVMPVERVKPTEKGMDFAVCVSVSYSSNNPYPINNMYLSYNPYRLVEWFEMQRILGASQVTIYNYSLSDESSLVFQHYAQEGFVDFRQSHQFLPDTGELSIHLHMSPVLNDCMYRNMYKAKKIVVVDLDEVIVPQIHSDWASMLAAVEKNLPKSYYYQYRSYVFKNTYFYLDFPADIKQPKYSAFLQHRTRLPTYGNDVAIKSIIDPKVCIQLHNHACWAGAHQRQVSHEVDVDPSYGMNHHYKKCHFDHYLGRPGSCEKVLTTGISDDTLLRFRKQLLHNMEIHLRKLHFETQT